MFSAFGKVMNCYRVFFSNSKSQTTGMCYGICGKPTLETILKVQSAARDCRIANKGYF